MASLMLGLSDSVLSKTAIFPKTEGRKREITNESAWGSSLREANVWVSASEIPYLRLQSH